MAISAFCAFGADTDFEQPLVQARFDHLIPTSYPTFVPSFNRLKPTTEPLFDPGVATVHITENLTQAFDRPLLITSESPRRPYVIATVNRVVRASGTKPSPVEAVIVSPARPGSTVPVKASSGKNVLESRPR